MCLEHNVERGGEEDCPVNRSEKGGRSGAGGGGKGGKGERG